MTDKIIEGVFNEGKNRIDGKEYPFWSSFIISWLVINWKVIYITTSLNSVKLNDKIEQIEKLYSVGNWLDFTHPLLKLLLYPILASFFAVTVVPIINHFYLWIRKVYRDWDSTIENAEIAIKKNLIQKKIELQKEEKELIKERKGVLEEKQEVISLENEIKKSIYEKIIGNEEVKSLFIEMVQFIDKNNNQKDTVNESLGLDHSKYNSFHQFTSNNIVDYSIFNPIGEKNSKYFIYFTDTGKQIAFQMLKDGYLKEEDLEGKI